MIILASAISLTGYICLTIQILNITVTKLCDIYDFNCQRYIKQDDMKFETIQVTQEEIKMATRPNVYKNKKKYTRKGKHKGREI